MEGYCTCGARLAEQARFCHRCGRPVTPEALREEEERERAEQQPAAAATSVAEADSDAAPSGLRADLVLRAGWAAAILSQMGMMLTGLVGAQVLAPLVLVLGGGYAVHLYRRRSGSSLNVLQGLRAC